MITASLTAIDDSLRDSIVSAASGVLHFRELRIGKFHVVAFRAAGPLPQDDQAWDERFGSPLLFCFEACKQWTGVSQASHLLIVVIADRSPCAEIAVASVRTFARSLEIETADVGRTVSCIASDDIGKLHSFFLPTLTEAAAGLTLDLRSSKPCTSTFLPFKATSDDLGSPVAVVTGAARGLGFAIASRLAAESYSVLLVDIDSEELAKAEVELAASGLPARAFHADVRSKSDLDKAARAALELGSLKVWVNNAGVSTTGYVRDLAPDKWNQVFETNLRSAIYGTQVACDFLKDGGVIINISSTAAQTAGLAYVGCYNSYSPYAASKAAISALTPISAIDAASRGIRVNAIAPGPIRTELLERVYSAIAVKELASHIPSGRLGEPADVAAAVSYLASPSAAFITGHVLTIDGGLSVTGASR